MDSRVLPSLLFLAILPLAQAAPPPALPPQPSAQLQTFSSSWLEKLIGPLDASTLPRASLMEMETDYQARLPLASPSEKPVLQAAIQTCATFKQLMDEREKAAAVISHGTQPSTSTAQGSTRSARAKDDKRAHIREAQRDDDFVASASVNAANSQWKQRQEAWRNAIQQLLIREKQAEVVAAAAAPVTAPPASATKPEAAASPVIGAWLTESGNQIVLETDHHITGGRHGSWLDTPTAGGGHTYELHYNPPKDWVDYLKLSDDGKTLSGTTRGSKPITFTRP